MLPGTQRFDNDCWNNNVLAKCHWDNRLWGYACHVSKEIHTCNAENFTNPVLFQLLFMGMHDWSNKNCCNNQSTQAMHHLTIMGSQCVALFSWRMCAHIFCAVIRVVR